MRFWSLLLLLIPPTGLLASDFTTVEGVHYVPTPWADGDSFRVRFPDGTEHTLRLYGADCMESKINDDSDARRLRAQRRYFGISNYGQSSQRSIDLAKSLGEAATLQTRAWLEAPFTVHTTFADGRGSPQYPRIYAFVTTSRGKDLATLLVKNGLARAFGVYRSTPDGLHQNDYSELLSDAELIAARNGKGIWAYTDWDTLSDERQDQRREDLETQMAMGTAPLTERLDLNSAAKEELMRIPGVGEVTANAIIESRPFSQIGDLTRVHGIGEKTLENLRPWFTLE
ncbi:MAG: helix-hairpin-helix domain-containing protein [Kiritimatiellae bacterium]|jgi:competence protein ComEA|nr:helix-hairpin-helix domain-containing protein [Kiritimatiellia bacterium]